MRILPLAPLVGALLLVGALPAAAHVTVVGENAVPGGSDATITFRVPTESDKLSTVEVRVALPTATPMASVDMLAMPGWTETQKSITLATPIHTDDGDITTAVSEVDWKAQAGAEIKPGSFGEFTLIAGQLPDTASLTFKAIQTYSDGSVVSWIQVPAAGQTADDVDYPAPVLALGSAASAAAGSGVTVSATTAAPASTTLPTVLAVVALVLALVACAAVLAGAIIRRRSRFGPAPVTAAEAAEPERVTSLS